MGGFGGTDVMGGGEFGAPASTPDMGGGEAPAGGDMM